MEFAYFYSYIVLYSHGSANIISEEWTSIIYYYQRKNWIKILFWIPI